MLYGGSAAYVSEVDVWGEKVVLWFKFFLCSSLISAYCIDDPGGASV